MSLTMMKPIFPPPFGVALATRVGQPIGKNMEGKMRSVTGDLGYRKRFSINADGSTTMLKTRNGMPRFYTENACNIDFVVGSTTIDVAGTADHTLYFGDGFTWAVPTPGSFRLWLVAKIPGTFTITALTGPFSLSTSGSDKLASLTIPYLDALWYPETITVTYSGVGPGYQGEEAYELHVGSRHGCSRVGTATVI